MKRVAADAGARGVVYTSPEVTGPMVERALAPLVAGRSLAALCALRICDPAVGEGAFVVAIADYLARAIAALDPAADARSLAAGCIVGVDIDAQAIAVARAAVPGADLRVADALACDWGGARFDAVIGNPPYIRQERLAEATKAALRTFAVHDGVADLYVYFVELAHRLLRPGGRYCLVIPNKWMTAAYGRPLRAFLAPTIEGLADHARASLFEADAFPCIVWGSTAPASPTIHTIRVGATTIEGHHPRELWRDAPWHVDTAAERALIDRLARDFPRLGDLVGRPQRGVVTGCNRAFVVDRATRDALVAADPANVAFVRPLVRGRDLAPYTARAERFVLLLDRGCEPTPSILAHLAPFRAALEPGSGRKPGAYRWYELQDPLNAMLANPAPRLLYQDIQTAPACVLDDGRLVPDTTVWMLPTADPTILAILNSSLYAFYARRRFPPALNGAVRPKASYLQGLPIAQPSGELRRALATARGTEADALVADAYALTRSERRVVTPSTSSSPMPTTRATSATLNTGHT